MVRMLLVRGLISGLVAGLLALVFARIFGEPSIGNAIDFESAHGGHAHEGTAQEGTAEPEVVSRGVQSGVGLATAVLVYSVAFGGLFSLAFATAYGRVGQLSARATAAVLALGGYLVVYVVPFLKYPANPPAVGNEDTISQRTGWYLGMVVISVLLAVVALYLGRQLTRRLGGWYAALTAGAAYLVMAAGAAGLLPSFNETPATFPASVLWDFRIASLGTQLIMWAALGLLFGALITRQLTRTHGRTGHMDA